MHVFKLGFRSLLLVAGLALYILDRGDWMGELDRLQVLRAVTGR